MEETLKNIFRLNDFRKGQKEIISDILAQKDVLAVLPTGGGKSLCYQFPAVYLKQLVIVISPLIALMKDQVYALQKLGIPSGCLHSGQTEEEKRAVFAQYRKSDTFVMYLSPERAQKEGFHKWIQDKKIALFAIDEAHCVSQWGHDFREEYSQLSILKKIRPDVPILALTASATPLVLEDIAKNLKLVDPEKRIHGFYRPNLYYQVETCAGEDEKRALLREALRKTPEGRIIIYSGTRRLTERLADVLQPEFKKIGFYHAGMSPEERTKTQELYQKSKLRILVATNAFGMGVDQADVRLVVHYQMPANIDSLYQEMGRAGRDGKDSTCLMLYAAKDKGLQSYFIINSNAPSSIKRSRRATLDAIVNYAEGGECRHAEILTYYKDSQRIERCGHCDTCDPESPRRIVMPVKEETAPLVSKPKKKTGSSATVLHLDHDQEERFKTLKKWRKEKAQELDLPAFVIFSDQTLRHLAVNNPKDLEQLRETHGVGDAKLEKFGKDLLAILWAQC